MGIENRRKNVRVLFQATVDLKFHNQTCEGCETQDLSIKGAFVVGIGGRKAGDQCDVLLRLTGSTSDLVLNMKGEVVRVESDGVALLFSEVDLDSYHHLRNIVYYNAENPEEAAEEFMASLPGKPSGK